MGVKTEEKVERNVALYNEWLEKSSILALQNKYDLSASAVHNIIKRYKKKNENKIAPTS